jgi:hypothetical protein
VYSAAYITFECIPRKGLATNVGVNVLYEFI